MCQKWPRQRFARFQVESTYAGFSFLRAIEWVHSRRDRDKWYRNGRKISFVGDTINVVVAKHVYCHESARWLPMKRISIYRYIGIPHLYDLYCRPSITQIPINRIFILSNPLVLIRQYISVSTFKAHIIQTKVSEKHVGTYHVGIGINFLIPITQWCDYYLV